MSDNATGRAGSFLDVGDDHQVYVEAVGEGIPIVFLHGGPGSGVRPEQRALFDPKRYRAIFFDQRGAGRSRPSRNLRANTTQHLIDDLEAIRVANRIERWIVVGGSWGATLALAYAQRHVDRVAGVVLRAVFLGTRRELNWAFLEGPRAFRPDLLADFLSLLTPEEQIEPLEAYWRRILDPDRTVHAPARWAWHDTERVLSEVRPSTSRVQLKTNSVGPLPATPLFEAHYFSNSCFLEPDQLLRDATRLAGIPGEIVQGRFDFLCPPAGSSALGEVWSDAEINVVDGAGHAMSEPGIRAAVIDALDRVADRARLYIGS